MGQGKNGFTWYEALTGDVEEAIDFYGAVIGWTTMKWDGGESPYTMFRTGERAVGGVYELPDEAREAGAPPHWLGYVHVEDADATAALIEKHGGRLLRDPFDVPDVGRIVLFSDPTGATLGLHQPVGDPPPKPDEPESGDATWRELMSTDPNAAWAFYSTIFAWEETDTMEMENLGTYRMYGEEGKTYGGIMQLPPVMDAPSHWVYYFTVDDIGASIAAAKERGGTLMNGPMEVPGGDLVAQLLDSQGAPFALHQFAADD